MTQVDPDDFIKRAKEIEQRKKKRTIIFTSIILTLSVFYLIYTSFIVHKTNNEKNDVAGINASLSKEVAKKDSIITDVFKSVSRQDSLLGIVNNYFELRNHHDAESLESYYADTVIRYFKNLKNVSRNLVTASDKKYWGKFKADKFSITEPIQILVNAEQPKAIIKGLQCYDASKCYEELVEIHFDNNNKIDFVRAYYEK